MSDHQPGPGKTGPRGPMGRMGGHGPIGMARQKPKNFRGTLKKLLVYLRPYKVNLVLVFILSILSVIFAIGAPQVIRLAMNKLQDSYMASTVLARMEKLQDMLGDAIRLHMNGRTGDDPGPPATLPEETLKAVAEFQQLPDLSSLDDPDQKADVCEKIINISKIISGLFPKAGGVKKSEFTEDQFAAAVRAIRETNGKIDFKSIGIIVIFLIGIYLFSTACRLVMQLLMVNVSQKTVYEMRKDVDHKLSRLPLKYFDSRTHGEVLSRVTNDIDTISTTLQQSLTQIITSVVSLLGYIIMMLTISPALTLILLLSLPLYIIATAFITKRSHTYFSAQQKEIGEISGHVEEMFTGHKIVKAFGHENESIHKFNKINGRLYEAGWKAQFISGIMFPLMNFISNLGYVLICVIGGLWITMNRLKVGDITAFIQYARSFTRPIIQTAHIANIIQSTIACAERVFEVLEEKELIPENPEPIEIVHPEGEVAFKDVFFSYKEDISLIEHMNLGVKPGHTIAIVGPTGAGKTTLVNLIMRFYETKRGSITIDGMDIKSLRRRDLRSLIGMVLQDTWLFSGTIRDNIAYGRDNATEEEIVRAAKTARADHFIRTLPDGYDTILNEEATNISQGQKQLLTIARAILANPVILILDEATSSVDTRTELLIQQTMSELMKEKTSFVIAHRLSTIRDAEVILVMNNGRIIEQGNHKALIAKNGFYAELYHSQFLGKEEEAGKG